MSFKMREGQNEESNDNRTLYCGNLSENVTDSVLLELFQQAGPVESIRRPRDFTSGRPKSFAFVVYKHECSIPYALEIFRGVKLFNRIININSRSNLIHIPVLDTHITEFTEPRGSMGYEEVNVHETTSRRYQEREDNGRERNRNETVCVQEFESRVHQNMEDSRRDHNRSDNHRQGNYNQSRRSNREKDADKPKSWTEYNALRGNILDNVKLRSNLPRSSQRQGESSNASQMVPDFNSLLQMGQQMLLSSVCMGLGGFPFPNMMPTMGSVSSGFGGNNRRPSTPDNDRYSPERDRRRRDNRRESRRDHPYNDQVRHDHRENHSRHDQRYYFPRSTQERERRDRQNR